LILKDILESAGIKPETCASLLGIDADIFNQWITGQRPLPPFIVPQLSSVLGIKPDSFVERRSNRASNMADLAPAIWFKLRGGNLSEADRENIVIIRRLGFYLNQLEAATVSPTVAWKGIFDSINASVDKQGPPRRQGREAAKMLRQIRGLHHGATGIGSFFRASVRELGVSLIESPVPKSNLEGCAFYVGQPGNETPCIFANSYKSSWFRRNMVIAHELGHAIFDIANDAVSLDYLAQDNVEDFRENRAEAFAQELLVPFEVIRHAGSTNGLRWDQLTAGDLALLISLTHVEQRTVVNALLEAGFITEEQAAAYKEIQVGDLLKDYSDRALTTKEFVKKIGREAAMAWAPEKRQTTIPSRTLRLPVPYVAKVIDAVRNDDISYGKAAEMLMVDRDTFFDRFGGLVEASK
jgi:Zn-dependent peptidase ImmA (M78 family)